jgi:hypothetical protein
MRPWLKSNHIAKWAGGMTQVAESKYKAVISIPEPTRKCF